MKVAILCSHCGIEINRRSNAKYCSVPCRDKAYYQANPSKMVAKRAYERGDFARYVLARVKARAKRDNIPFNIDVSDIETPEYCSVLGIKLAYNFGNGSGFHSDSPSVDKIIPKLGYVKGNVRVISARANLLKNDATIEELELVLEDLKKLKRN